MQRGVDHSSVLFFVFSKLVFITLGFKKFLNPGLSGVKEIAPTSVFGSLSVN